MASAAEKEAGLVANDHPDLEKEIGIQGAPSKESDLPHEPSSNSSSSDNETAPSSDLHFPSLAIGDALSNTLSNSLSRTTTTDPESRPTVFTSTTKEILFTLTATFAVAQTSILFGAISGVTSHIALSLSMTQAEVTWLTASTSLSAGAFLMFFGSVADQFGRRWMLVGSMAFFAIFCLIAGFANGAIFLDVIMALMGLCSASAVPPAIGILGAVYKKPSKRKNMAFACFSAGNPLGFVAGIFISGVCYKVSTWRTSFWVLAVIYAFFTVAAWFSVPGDVGEKAPLNWETLKKFDYLGVVLASGGIALVTTALTIGPQSPQGWRTPYVIAMLIIGVVLIGLFIAWERVFSRPLMPLGIWKDKNFCLLIIIMCLGFSGFSGNTFWTALYWQKVENIDPLAIALRLLPQAIVGLSVNAVAGLIMHRVSNKLLMGVGALGFTGSFALFSAFTNTVSDSYWKFMFPALCLSVVGADFEFTVTNMYVMSSLPPSQQSIAGGLFNTVTRLGTSIGLGVSTAAYSALNGGSSEIADVLRPYRATWWVALGTSGISLIFVPFLTIKRPGAKKK